MDIDTLLSTVDWKGISKTDIEQISHEVKFWADDYEKLQEAKKLLDKPLGKPFEEKFKEWIPDRIKMIKQD